ncbi:MAG TPA: DUF4404 family protein [Blastocatellia bacterium]|nr:DUF4404 family protein [Blastocatellia bacterium]
MDRRELQSRLAQLHSELQQVETVDENERDLLRKLSGDIQELLESQPSDAKHQRLGEGLRESIELLEASHPRLTMLMGQVIDQLAKMGI